MMEWDLDEESILKVMIFFVWNFLYENKQATNVYDENFSTVVGYTLMNNRLAASLELLAP